MGKKKYSQVQDYDINYVEDKDDSWSETSPERSSYESDEDYEERMNDLYGEDWNC